MRFERRIWRESYKAVVVLEYLMTHGPESVAEEFQTDRDVIKEMENFQHIDEKGYIIHFMQRLFATFLCALVRTNVRHNYQCKYDEYLNY